MRYCLWGHRRGWTQLKLRRRHEVTFQIRLDTQSFLRQVEAMQATMNAWRPVVELIERASR